MTTEELEIPDGFAPALLALLRDWFKDLLPAGTVSLTISATIRPRKCRTPHPPHKVTIANEETHAHPQT
jgi:hypothetical protein